MLTLPSAIRKKFMSKKIIAVLFFVMLISGSPQAYARFDGQKASEYLVKQVAFGPGDPGSPGHERCLEFLKSELEKTADEVKLQSFKYGLD